jgi:hypothetical protein
MMPMQGIAEAWTCGKTTDLKRYRSLLPMPAVAFDAETGVFPRLSSSSQPRGSRPRPPERLSIARQEGE